MKRVKELFKRLRELLKRREKINWRERIEG